MPDAPLTDEEIAVLIRHHLPNPMAVKIVDSFLRHARDVASVADIADDVDKKPAAVKPMIRELIARGVLKSLGSGMFNFAPDHKLKEQLDIFFQLWHNPATQKRMMKLMKQHGRTRAEGSFLDRLRALFGK